MTGERGSVTFWVLGLTVAILGFGGIALDFWRAIAVQREIAAIADAATVAAASATHTEPAPTHRSSRRQTASG